MKVPRTYRKYLKLLPLLAVSSPLMANSLGGSVSLQTLHSDNANKAAENGIGEQQSEYGLSLQGEYQSANINFNADYAAKKEVYSKGFQEDRTALEGGASLIVGDPLGSASLTLSHSQQLLLNAPDAINLSNNLDERSILTAAPRLQGEVSQLDSVILVGDFSKISYKGDELRDSNRTGGTLTWLHRLSKISDLQFLVNNTDIEYVHFANAGYKYLNAQFIYSSRLRQLSYSVKVGQNKSESDLAETYSAPSYGLSARYLTGPNNFSLSFDQAITDSSMGDGNSGSSGSLPGSDGSATPEQMNRKSVTIDWQTMALCDRCVLSVGAGKIQDTYLQTSEVSNETRAQLTMKYNFSRALSASLGHAITDNSYEAGLIGGDYKLSTLNADVDYKFSKGPSIKVFVLNEKRSSSSASYTEAEVGLKLQFNF